MVKRGFTMLETLIAGVIGVMVLPQRPCPFWPFSIPNLQTTRIALDEEAIDCGLSRHAHPKRGQ